MTVPQRSRADLVFAALGDPTRRAILDHLRDGDAGAVELAGRFPISQPAVSKHLNVLESAGLISRYRRAGSRPCHLEAEALREAARWLGTYEEFWRESFDRLDAYAETLTTEADDG